MSWGEQFCSQLRSVFGADLASLNGLNPDLSLAWAMDSPAGTCHGEVAEAVARLAGSHPVVCWGSRHIGMPGRLGDFHPWSSFRHTELYADIYRPLGLRHELDVVVRASRGRLVVVAMQRVGSDFDEAARDRLLLLGSVLTFAGSMLWSALELERQPGGVHASDGSSLLTPRECQVLSLLADGARDADIGRLCQISPATAKKHVEHVLSKLGVGTRAGAVAVGFQRKLLPRP
jgi:DNA-binding CsgD family transcriptional regulator